MEIWSISVSLRSQNKFRLQWVNFLPLIPFTHSQKTKGHYTTGRPRTEGKPQPPSGSGSALAHTSDRPAVEAPAPIRFLRFCRSEIVLCLKYSWWVFFLLKDPHTKTRRLAPASGVPAFRVTMQITTWHTLDLAVNTLPTPLVSVTSPYNSCSTETSFFVREGLLSTDWPLCSWEWL